MNISQTAVTNAVNLAFLMVNLSRRLLRDFRRDHQPQFSILDLKDCYMYKITSKIQGYLISLKPIKN